MGSGIGKIKKTNQDNLIQNKYGANPEKIFEVDGNFYYKMERNEFRLSDEVLDYFSKANTFSRDLDKNPKINYK